MSNLSSIGFPLKEESELHDLINKIYSKSQQIEAINGSYVVYQDKSGAEIWLQFQNSNLIGLNPHFNGKSVRMVAITNSVPRTGSEMDGAFHAWAEPTDPGEPDSGWYPFVFDVPDFFLKEPPDFPLYTGIQLAAFAFEIQLFDSESDYSQSQSGEVKLASKAFIPSGMFFDESATEKTPQAVGWFTGEINDFALIKNNHTGKKFYWFLVDTLGGNVDVVADPNLIQRKPKKQGYLTGQFWLSGKLLRP